jgi:hypothetical protein
MAILLAAAIGMTAAVTNAVAQEPPRKNTQYFPFERPDPATSERVFDSFIVFTRNLINTYGEQLKEMSAKGGEQKPLDHLSSLKVMPNSSPTQVITTSKLQDLWIKPQVLQIWTGNVFHDAGQNIVVTDAYLGDAKGQLPQKQIQLEQVYSYRAIKENKNSHLALTVYALAMDLKNKDYSADTVLTFLQEAQLLASVLDDSIEGHKALKDAIDASIEELNPPKEDSGP